MTLVTPPVNQEHLRKFVARVNPVGAWPATLRDSRQNSSEAGRGFQRQFGLLVLLWLLSSTSVLSMMFSIGYLIFNNLSSLLVSLTVMVVTGWPAWRMFHSELD
ncbi:MAG: hypothetical protein H3C43_04340 [Leptonema sp. (in: Bacteria)]|nr:hypothetical protein [Leptonema sp. (in: bacteria)]